MNTLIRVSIGTVGAIVALGVVYCMKSEINNDRAILTLNSTSFGNGAPIPTLYTCDGSDVSPALSWTLDHAENVRSYVLIVDDPDAQKVVGKTYVHWVVILSDSTTNLPEGISTKLSSVDAQAQELKNDASQTRYKGPCPPQGSGTHRYRFTLFATKEPVAHVVNRLQAPCTAEACSTALADSIVTQTRITGTYTRT